MKQCFILLFATLVSLVACNTEIISPEIESETTLSLDLTIKYVSDIETKGTKTGWVSGDKIFIFFKDVTAGYLTITYDGSTWGNATLCGITVNALTESGSTLTAIYLPYGNDAIPSYGTKWTFNKANDTYYLKAEKQSYTVTKLEGIATLSATLSMAQQGRFIQFFVPDENASGTALLSCNNICPQGLGSISSDGTCKALYNTTNCGYQITGYAATIGGDKGYYFYGTYYPFSQASKMYYYFTLEKGGEYYDYLKYRATEISDQSAVKLSSMRQVGTGIATKATIGSYLWATVNYGASKPWEYDATQYTWPGENSTAWSASGISGLAGRGEAIPTADQIANLCNGSNKYRIMAGGVVGYLFIDKTGSGGYMFLACSGEKEGSDVGNRAYCWSSTSYDADEAKFLYSTTWDVPKLHDTGYEKFDKISIRAVKQ